MQTDPIGYDDQVNLYAYVGNDPVNMVDPDGEVGKLIKAGIKLIKHGGNPKKAGKEFVGDVIEAGTELLDGDLTIADAEAVFNLASPVSIKEIKQGANALKSLKSSTKIGDRVKTPANSPDSFTPLKNGQGDKDKKTGIIFQKSNTNHSNSLGGEFKAGTKRGELPEPKNKDTLSGGKDGGCLIKRNRC